MATLVAWFRNRPIRTKLRLINLATISLSFLMLTLVLIVHTWYSSRQAVLQESLARAQVVATNIAPTLLFADPKAASETLASLRFAPEVSSARVFNHVGRHFAAYLNPAVRVADPFPEQLRRPDGSAFDGDRLEVTVPIEIHARRVGTLHLAVDLGPVTERVLTYTLIITVTGILALLLGTGMLDHLQGGISARIANLAALMQQVSRERDYKRRAQIAASGDEIGALASCFNAMLEQIQIRDGDLSKELNERRHAEKKLHRLAHYDTLTELPNRHFFNLHLGQRLAALAENSGELGLMFIDLDNFKYINDTFGHHAGDLLLITVAQRLRAVLRTDDFICRLGGDEFAVVFGGARHPTQAEAIALKMLEAMKVPFNIDGNEYHAGASIGIALAPEHAQDATTLVRRADAAMYKAKQTGRNRHMLWHSEMDATITRRYQLEAGLRKARDNGELRLQFQPIHHLDDGRLVGVEALLRWQHPHLGLIAPDEFIPIAEESAQIDSVGFWAIEEASRRLAVWRRHQPDLFAAVNLSVRQFADERLPDRIAATLARYGLPTSAMELEITEGLMVDASPRVMAILYRFAELGLSLALDDFGTGYSSLAYLSRYPFRKIKIDRSFVMALQQGGDNGGIIPAIVGMGRSLHMQVVAEGIETEWQRRWLIAAGCEMGQGFHFAPPMDADAISRQLGTMLAVPPAPTPCHAAAG